ncbi:MAG: type II toxin-antitoxin system RelE/ParE family toxin [Phycisphaeraceae bacterium]
MAEIRWTQEAESWLKEIHDYIAHGNPSAAIRTVDGIVERAESLREFPLLGHRYEGRTDRHYRVLWYGHYRIVYLVVSDDRLEIVGVFHEALDIERFF